jgi:hypothetical protein
LAALSEGFLEVFPIVISEILNHSKYQHS